MLAPERESPGTSARAWAVPIPTASRKLSRRARSSSFWMPPSSRDGARRLSASAPNSISPLTSRKIAAVCVEANRDRSGCSSK